MEYDDLFLSVLKNERNIAPFLNRVFGFLYRRTDFYCIQADRKARVGFPAGVAEIIVREIYKKWERAAHPQPRSQPLPIPNNQVDDPDFMGRVDREIEIETTPYTEVVEEIAEPDSTTSVDIVDDDPPNNIVPPAEKEVTLEKLPYMQIFGETLHPDSTTSVVKVEGPNVNTFNGADCGSYKWTQTLQDVDIEIPVRRNITKACDVKVDIYSQKLVIHVKDGNGWKCLVNGKLVHKNLKEESIWSLIPGQLILVHLEKCKERWWRSVLKTEPELDPASIEVEQSMTELGQEDMMMIEQLLWNERERNKERPAVDETKRM